MNAIGIRSMLAMLMLALSMSTVLVGVPAGHAMLAPADQSSPTVSQRMEDLRTVQSVLEAKIITQRLQDLGYSSEEIASKLDRLSDSQLHQVASQINSLFPAGFHGATDDILHVALTVLLIVVIVVVILALV
jgi:ribose 1,5-bisphosphokinase PhnN